MASRNNPSRTGAKRPFSTRITFNGSTGLFEYYDAVKREKVELEELKIIPLVTKSIISGFSKKVSQQIMSNYVEDITTEPFEAFYFNNKKYTRLDGLTGLWADIKEEAQRQDGNFSTSIIGLVVIDDLEVIAELVVSRFTLGQWINITNENPDVMSSSLILKRGPLYKKGAKTGDPAIELTKAEETKILDGIKKNPMKAKPVIFYGLEAEATPLTDKELDYTDGKITVIEDYFDQMASRSVHQPARAGSTMPQHEEQPAADDDDLPF